MLPIMETVDGDGALLAFEEMMFLLIYRVELMEARVTIQGEKAGVALVEHRGEHDIPTRENINKTFLTKATHY